MPIEQNSPTFREGEFSSPLRPTNKAPKPTPQICREGTGTSAWAGNTSSKLNLCVFGTVSGTFLFETSEKCFRYPLLLFQPQKGEEVFVSAFMPSFLVQSKLLGVFGAKPLDFRQLRYQT